MKKLKTLRVKLPSENPELDWSEQEVKLDINSTTHGVLSGDRVDIEIGGRNYWAIAKGAWHAYLSHQGDGIFTNNSTSQSFAIFSMHKLGVPVGETYTVSFEINVSDDAIQFSNDLFYVNGASPSAEHNMPVLVKDKWVKVFANINYTVENTSIAHIYFNGIPSSNSFQIRNFQLEKGNVATDWTPAPEDRLEIKTLTITSDGGGSVGVTSVIGNKTVVKVEPLVHSESTYTVRTTATTVWENSTGATIITFYNWSTGLPLGNTQIKFRITLI